MLHLRIQSKASQICLLTFRNVHGVNRFPCVKDADFILKHTALCSVINLRWKSSSKAQNSALSEAKEGVNAELTIGEKVKQTTKDAGYLGVIIAGVSITGIMFYSIGKELFSGKSPNSVYSSALEECRNDPRITDALGLPIKGYGELSSRGRRRHVSHLSYEKDGKNYMRMKFYVEGSRKKGTVHLEVKEGIKGNYEYRYLFADIEGYPPRTIILKDNRSQDASSEVPILS